MRKRAVSFIVAITTLTTGVVAAPAAMAAGTISLTSMGTAVTEDFNSLAVSLTSTVVPAGWDFAEASTNADTTYSADDGGDNQGDTYSYGGDLIQERAFGGLRSGTLIPTIGAALVNNTGTAIASLEIAYTGEQWRAGVANRLAADRLDFQLSTDATSLSTGTWTDHDALDFASPNTNAALGALDGNASGNRTAISATISGLDIRDGATFWIRWSDVDIASADDGLAIDDVSITPRAAGPDACTLPFTSVHEIQGSGASAAITGPVTTQGIVVGDYQDSSSLRGIYLQGADADADPQTSEGIFVFTGATPLLDVGVGDLVQVEGTAEEFASQTQLGAVTSIRVCSTGNTVTPTTVNLPLATATDLERFEGMLVTLPQTLTVTDTFTLGRFGDVELSSGGRLPVPTAVAAPGAPAAVVAAQNAVNRILVDDATQTQNADPIVFARGGQPLSASNTLRAGDTATGTVGVLTQTPAAASIDVAYRVRPIGALGGNVGFVAANARPSTAPDVGGDLRVVGMSLGNLFDSFDSCYPTFTANSCRGADSATELTRQTAKIVSAIVATDPDVLGVTELENDGSDGDSSIAFLVAGLNLATAPGTFAYVDTGGPLGTDAIRQGFVYKPATVTPVGAPAVLDSTAFVNGGDPIPRNRPSIAQAFEDATTGSRFVVDVNHLKSRGTACSTPDAGDGQGECNEVRTNAMEALLEWLGTDPTGAGDTDILVLGDLGSYAMEDPIAVATQAGYTDLISTFEGADAYSWSLGGEWGSLSHALGSASMTSQVTGVATFHINADEPSILDYNVEFKSAGHVTSLYAPDPFRSSNQDPVVIGLDLEAATPTADAGGPYAVDEGGSVTLSATGADPNGATVSYAWDLDGDSSFETPGQSVVFSAALLDGPDSRTVSVQVTGPGGATATDDATVEVRNAPATVSASFAGARVACGVDNGSLQISFSDPGVADTHTATVDWGDGASQDLGAVTSPSSVPHTYAAAGAYTATVTVTDDDGASTTTTASVAVEYASSGVLQPIDADGGSVFKAKSTIRVRIRFTDCDGTTPTDLAPTIAVALVSRTAPTSGVNELSSGAKADTSGVMRFSDGHYVYNLSARSLPDPSATYELTITVPATGQTSTARFGLRR